MPISRKGESEPGILASLAERRTLAAETRHIIKGLGSLPEAVQLQETIDSICDDIARASSLEHLRGISQSLNTLRRSLRDACHRVSSTSRCNWQSPPVDHSLNPSVREGSAALLQAGVDYHRAAHLAGQRYEAQLAGNLLGDHTDCRLIATSCGMSAISTALLFIATKIGNSTGAIIADAGCYHETRFLLEGLFQQRLQYLDLTSPEAVRSLEEIKPDLVVFDSTRNSKEICRLPLTDIMAATQAAHSYLLIDSTSMVSAAPIVSAAKTHAAFERVLVAHSLAKLHQYGMDLVTGGALIYAAPLDQTFPSPVTYRTHLGMNISEDSATALPATSLPLLTHRAQTMSRNVQLLSSALADSRDTLCIRTAQSWDEPSLLVPYFNLSLIKGDEISWYRSFITRAMDSARARGLQLIAGTSFGFDTTRIYLVESFIPSHRPFIRIAPGMETYQETSLLAEALIEAVGEI